VCPEDHVTGMEANDSIRMGGAIVEQVSEGLHGGLSAVSLLGGKGTKGDQHGRVNSVSIVMEDTNNFLDVFAISSIKDSGVVGGWGILDFCTIIGVLPSMGGMFRAFWMGVSELQEGPFNVSRHGEVNSALVIVPLKGKTTIPGGCPIFSDLIMLPEGIEEVGGIIPVGVSNNKAIDNQGESDVTGVMLPEPRGEQTGVIAVGE